MGHGMAMGWDGLATCTCPHYLFQYMYTFGYSTCISILEYTCTFYQRPITLSGSFDLRHQPIESFK